MNKADEIKKLLDRLDASYGPEASATDNELAFAALHAAIDAQQAEIEARDRAAIKLLEQEQRYLDKIVSDAKEIERLRGALHTVNWLHEDKNAVLCISAEALAPRGET